MFVCKQVPAKKPYQIRPSVDPEQVLSYYHMQSASASWRCLLPTRWNQEIKYIEKCDILTIRALSYLCLCVISDLSPIPSNVMEKYSQYRDRGWSHLHHSVSQSIDIHRIWDCAILPGTDASLWFLSSCPLFPLPASATDPDHLHFHLLHNTSMATDRLIGEEGFIMGNIGCTEYMVD